MKSLIRFSIYLLALMWVSHISAQTITTTAGTITSCAGNVMVPLDVSGFTGVSALSLVLQYDTSVLTYTGYQNLRTELEAGTYLVNQDKNQFIITWYSVSPVTLTDGSFIELLFTTNGGTSDLVWDLATAGNCEFSDQDGYVISADFINGQVNAPGSVAQIYTQPASQEVYEGDNVSYSFSAGGAIAYQWQESTDGGNNWSDLTDGGMYSGTTGSYFTIYGIILGMDGRQYRCVFEGVCPPADTTDAATLSVEPVPPTITITASTLTSCAGDVVVPVTVQDFLGVAAFSLTLGYDTTVLTFSGYQGLNTSIDAPAFVLNNSGGSILMTWYTLTPVDIPGDTLVELLFTTSGQYSDLSWDTGTEGSCEIVNENSTLINTIYQNGAVNTAGNPPFIYTQPADAEIFPGETVSFSVNAYSISSYRWQESTDSGSTWTDLSNDATYWNTGWYQMTINGADLSFNGYQYRCRLTGPCPPDTVTEPVTLTVSPLPQIITATLPDVTRCDDTLSIPLYVENFNDVSAISMTINFDTSMLVYTGIGNVHPALTGSVIDNDADGTLFISWASLTPAAIGDTILLELGFTALQDGYSSLSWNTEIPGSVEFSDPDGNIIQQSLVAGSVNVFLTAPEEVFFTGLDSVYCSNTPISTLEGTPSGGTFYGPGISGPDFDPATAGAGTHTITYIYTNIYGCEYPATRQTTVLAQPLPVADFSYTVDLLELGLTNLSANATDYSWDFGDGEADTVTSPVHTYASANNYTVLLTAASACGYDTSAQVIVVGSNLPPQVVNSIDDMTWPEDSLETVIDITSLFSDPNGDTLTFSVSSDNISVVTVSLSNTTLTITTTGPGTATVTVGADDGHGGTASDVFVVQVNPLPPLTISYTRSDVTTAGGNDGSIQLTVSGGTPPYTFSWSNGAITASLSHLRSGYYTVTVTDALLHTISETIEITGPSGQTCEFSISFTWEADTLITRNIRFTPSTTEYDLQWSFGDGYTSGVNAPLHSFDRSGLYRVCLVAYDEITSCSYETCQMVQAGTLNCLADYDFYVDQGDSMRLHFSDNSYGALSKWYWNFADGDVSTDQNPTHRFTRPGIYPVCLYTFDEATGCLSESCKEIRVGWVDMIAGFTYFVDPVTLEVTFTNNSVGNITNYYWTYGDGNISAAKESSHVYGESGLYTVCLSIRNSGTGQYTSICHEIQVGTPACDIHASFSYFVDPSSNTVNFTDISSGNVDYRFWNFGDGVSATSPNPVHQYSKPGYYLVGLSVRDNNAGCNDFHTVLIQAGQAECKSLFAWVVDPVTLTVSMKDQSLGDIASYYWTFDDGHTSAESNPVHQFDAPGLHEISLTVRDETGTCMDYKSEMVQAGTADCSADFNVFIDSLTNTAWFNSQSVGQQIRYYWIFSDGTTSTEKDPMHTFSVPGYHVISLNTFNEQSGCMDFNSQVILIGSQGIDCEASFIYQADESTNTVTFADKSLGTGLSWYWNFGDEGFSTGQNPVHDYTAGGYYNVCLTVYSGTGIQNTTCKQVFTGPLAIENCLARFIYTVNDADLEVNYTDKSFGTPDAWEWEFGDQQKAIIQHPSHTFAEAGYYTSHMRIENQVNGCVGDAFALVSVDMAGELRAGFGYTYDSTITTKAESYPVDYVGVSLGDASKYKWSFGDGAYDSTTTTPSHVYTAPGIYYVCLTVYDEVAGTKNTTCDSVRVPLTTSVPPVYDLTNIQLLCYPNPADGICHVLFDLTSASYTDVALYTVSGQKLHQLERDKLSAGRHKLELNAAGLAIGLYIIKLQSDSGTATKILSVQH